MRFEYKYQTPYSMLGMLQQRILPFMRKDKFAAMSPTGQYTVRSIYFDTPDFEMYHTKNAHLAHRQKVRLRGYNEGSNEAPTFLEIKRKYEGPIVKNRSEAPFGVVQALFKGADFASLEPQIKNPDDARRFFYQVHSRRLRPMVNVIYEREPYHSQVIDLVNDFRITFDLNLRGMPYPRIGELFYEENARYVDPDFFTLEIKFNRYCPAWVKPIVEELKLFREPSSKYTGCVDACQLLQPLNRPIESCLQNIRI